MKIDATTFAKLPEHMQALFIKAPNPGRDDVLAGFPSNVEGKDNFKHSATSIFGSKTKATNYNGNSKSTWGSAARFFYSPKASKRDRDEGLEGFEAKPAASAYGDGLNTATKIRTAEQAETGVDRDLRRNIHPTVKPTDLMRYLCRLVTPPGGTVLDPFMGSGSTGKAALLEGFKFVGIERDLAYFEIANARIKGDEQMSLL